MNRFPSRYQRGVSLLELIVSLTLGMIILLGLISIYEVGSKSSRQADDIIDMNAKANLIMSRLGYDFDHAGYIDLLSPNPANPSQTNAQAIFTTQGLSDAYQGKLTSTGAAPTPPLMAITGVPGIYGCLGEMSGAQMAGSAGGGSFTPLKNLPTCGAPGDGRHQSLQVAYQITSAANADDTQSLRGPDTSNAVGWDLDCLGGRVDPSTNGGFVSNRYSLDADGDFRCSGSASNSGAQTLVHDVQAFVVRYRITTPTAGNIKSGLETVRSVAANQIEDTALNPLGLAGVTGVEVCLVLRSHDRFPSVAKYQTSLPSCVAGANGQFERPRPAGDWYFYKRYVSSFALPNKIYSRQ